MFRVLLGVWRRREVRVASEWRPRQVLWDLGTRYWPTVILSILSLFFLLSLSLSSFFLLLCSCLASLCSSLENTAVPVHTNTKQPSLIIQTFYTCLYCKSTTQMHYRIKENDKYYVGYSCNKYRKCIFVTKNNEP